ncbi:MAG: hypothetical protein IT305_23250 [Chloroflexi bacterium]|nr:hypothetical protein [Chloroflexota bacterium]
MRARGHPDGIRSSGRVIQRARHVEYCAGHGGYRFRDEEMHLRTFESDGKIVEFRHVTDTAKHVAAIRG